MVYTEETFMDLHELAEYRRLSRKDKGLSDKVFKELLLRFYNYYMNKRTRFLRVFEIFETCGRRPDGTVHLGVLVIMRSTPDKQKQMLRIPHIYKTLTALYATPYQVVSMIQAHLDCMNVNNVRLQLKYDDMHPKHKSASLPSLRSLVSYTENPERTSIAWYNGNLVVTLYDNR